MRTQPKEIVLLYGILLKNNMDLTCDDRADSFLIVSLMYAMKSHQDIVVNAPVSRRLLYHIIYDIQPLFTKLIPGSRCVLISGSF